MKIIIIVLFVIFNINGLGQNLVFNPGFEQYTVCPSSWSEVPNSTGWLNFGQSPDYFNTCTTTPNIAIPNNHYGFQFSHSGNAYVGLCPFSIQFPNAREFIGSQLSTFLSTGQKYYISFYVSPGGQNGATIASNKMGIKFSTVPYSYSNPAPINNSAHFYTDTIITDTVKWTKISGSFIVDSAYSYIIIGNFFNDSLTDTLNLETTNNNYAYYYIDDVCVTTDSLYNENWTGINEQTINKSENITIYPNPCTNELNLQFNNVSNEQTTISIIDITGKTIMQTQTTENEFIFNTEKLAKGLYLVKVETGETILQQRVVKE